MIACIVNPMSAGGKTAALLPHLREGLTSRWGSEVEFLVTTARGDARRETTSHLRRSRNALIVIVGGDGTLQEAVNGWCDTGLPSNGGGCLGLISSGTGQGFAQGIGLPSSVREQMDVLVQGTRRRIDLGEVEYRRENGDRGRRYFVNECQIGIGGAVVRDVESRPRRWNGRWTFGLAAMQQALTLPNHTVEIARDGVLADPFSILGLVFGNGAFTGGGMNLTPGASPFDGELDLLVMREQTVLRRIANLRRIYSARHIGRPEFTLHRCRTAAVSSPEPVAVEADGEFLGSTPCSISVVPSALTFVVPRRTT